MGVHTKFCDNAIVSHAYNSLEIYKKYAGLHEIRIRLIFKGN